MEAQDRGSWKGKTGRVIELAEESFSNTDKL